MSGHSQFKNIMHRKGAQDKIRARTFSKLGREITVAAKSGLPDPAYNPRLRAAIAAARAENMPKDNIKRAIEKAAAGDAANYEEIRYEGFGQCRRHRRSVDRQSQAHRSHRSFDFRQSGLCHG